MGLLNLGDADDRFHIGDADFGPSLRHAAIARHHQRRGDADGWGTLTFKYGTSIARPRICEASAIGGRLHLPDVPGDRANHLLRRYFDGHYISGGGPHAEVALIDVGDRA